MFGNNKLVYETLLLVLPCLQPLMNNNNAPGPQKLTNKQTKAVSGDQRAKSLRD